MSACTCYLIGDDHLLLQCATVLLERKHVILGIISPLQEARKFAKLHSINYFDSLKAANSTLLDSDFDYLFSIINSTVLPLKVIHQAKKFAINFHNGPLPRYAGVHALSFAILNNETQHGVTWHKMAELLDSGDILTQALFPIDAHETGLSLSLKCYQYALITFKELLDGIEKNNLTARPQNLEERCYYSFNHKPHGNGWITWDESAEQIERMVRALELGHYHHNRLTTPKIKIKDQGFILGKLFITEQLSNEPPGTIINIEPDNWYIATKTYLICLKQLFTIEGERCELSELAEKFAMQAGYQLPKPTQEHLAYYKNRAEKLAPWELFWVQELCGIKPSVLPFQGQDRHSFAADKLQRLTSFRVNKNYLARWQEIFKKYKLIDVLLTTLLVYLYRLDSEETLGVGFYFPASQCASGIAEFFSPIVPFSISLANELKFTQALEIIAAHREKLASRLTYAKDVFYRYPELAQAKHYKYPIAFAIGDDLGTAVETLPKNAAILITLSEDKGEIAWWAEGKRIKEQPYLAKFIENTSHHFRVLLEGFSKKPQELIAKLPLLSSKERHKVLHEWSGSLVAHPPRKTIVQIFEEQVALSPSNIALIANNEAISYQSLNEKANQLAHYLREKGLLPDKFAAISSNQSTHLIIGILAILKTGGAYIPIDPNYPKKYIRELLEDCKPEIILVSKKSREKFKTDLLHQQLFYLEDIFDAIEDKSKDNLPISINCRRRAYVIYTSGTTGKPKGVVIPHCGVTRLVKNTNYIKITSKDKIALAASISFDAATFEIWGALLNGASLVAVGQNTLLDITQFGQFLEKNKISILWLTSALFNQYTAKNPSLFKGLTYLLAGGDILIKESVMSVLECEEGSPKYMINGYGPTENTTFTTTHTIITADKTLPTIPIGKPIANTQVFILDAYLQPTAIGVVGELYAGGAGLALEYLNRQELTKEKFIKRRLPSNTPQRLFKTGDRVRWMPNGEIEFLGRADKQVKIRGFRIELEAIQTQLLSIEGISQCVVSVGTKPDHSKTLIAYLVVLHELDIAHIKTDLALHLPGYMIPNYFVQIDAIPLTKNGKVDYRSLPLPDFSQTSISLNYAAPKTELEKSLAAIWCSLLEVEQVSIDDNFFDMGGHSLLITQLLIQLSNVSKHNWSLHDFLEMPTIRALASLIENKSPSVQINKPILYKDCVLPSNIKLDSSVKPSFPPKAILLTGSSGFLGVHMLKDLYGSTKATIYCLIRDKGINEARRRINATLANQGIPLQCNERIVPLVGDLALPLLGLTKEQFAQMANEIDIIYHVGAMVHHIYNYESLRAPNALSTLEILKLASYKKIKPIHFVSTLSAASQCLDKKGCIIEEYISPENAATPPTDGYSQSKWVAEQLFAQAASRGFYVSIYRPCWIMGQSHTGAIVAETNHLLLLIKGCIQLGAAPSWDLTLDLLPVDTISKLITSLSLNPQKPAKVFNLINPYKCLWIDLINYLQQRGYALSLVAPDEWKHRYLKKIDRDNALFSLYGLYINKSSADWMEKLSAISKVRDQNTKLIYRQGDIQPPEITSSLLDTYFNYLEKLGFINPNFKSNKGSECDSA